MWEAESMAHNPLIYVQGNNVGSVSGFVGLRCAVRIRNYTIKSPPLMSNPCPVM